MTVNPDSEPCKIPLAGVQADQKMATWKGESQDNMVGADEFEWQLYFRAARKNQYS